MEKTHVHAARAFAIFLASSGSIALGQCPSLFMPGPAQTPSATPVSVAVGDMNRDGRPDVVASTETNGLVVCFGSASGGLSAPQSFVSGSTGSNRNVVVADFNGDGRLDAAVAEYNGTRINVHWGDGSGGFTGVLPVSLGYSAAAGQSIAAADFNSDGKPDLVSADFGWNTVSVVLTNNSGGFQNPVRYTTQAGPTSIALADLNRDGRPDIVVGNVTAGSLTILLSSGAGSFGTPGQIAVGSQPNQVVAGDIDRDGKVDLITSHNDGSLRLHRGNGDGSFQAPTLISTASSGFMTVADANSDGNLDVVLSGVGVLYGRGDATFLTVPGVLAPGSVAAADIDGNGRTDLVFANGGGLAVLLNTGSSQPQITQQPANRVALTGSMTTFTTASAEPGAAYRWRRNGIALNDSIGVFGSSSPQLSLGSLTLADSGSIFDCLITSACGQTRSNAAGLIVSKRCAVDWNGNDVRDIDDIFLYLTAWFQGCP